MADKWTIGPPPKAQAQDEWAVGSPGKKPATVPHPSHSGVTIGAAPEPSLLDKLGSAIGDLPVNYGLSLRDAWRRFEDPESPMNKSVLPVSSASELATDGIQSEGVLGVVQGTGQALGDVVEGLATPGNMSLGVATLGGNRAASAVFGGLMGKGAYEQFQAAKEAKTTSEKTRHYVGGTLSTILGLSAGSHALKGKRPAPRAEPAQEQSSPKVAPEGPSPTVNPKARPAQPAEVRSAALERRSPERVAANSMYLRQLNKQLDEARRSGNAKEFEEIQAVIAREKQMQKEMAEPVKEVPPVRPPETVEGKVVSVGEAKKVELNPEALGAKTAFQKAHKELQEIEGALERHRRAKEGDFDRGRMKDVQVNWHTKQAKRLTYRRDQALKYFSAKAGPEAAREILADLRQQASSLGKIGEDLSGLVKSDKAAKAIRAEIPNMTRLEREAAHRLLGDKQSGMALKRLQFVTPRMQKEVDAAHQTLATEVVPNALRALGVPLEVGADLRKFTAQDLNNLRKQLQAQPDKTEAAKLTRLIDIIEKRDSVAFVPKLMKSAGPTPLPELTIRRVEGIYGAKQPSLISKATPKQKEDLELLRASGDKEATKEFKRELARQPIQSLADTAKQIAAEVSKQADVVGRFSGVQRKINRDFLDDLKAKRRKLADMQTEDIQRLVADNKTIREVAGSANAAMEMKAVLQAELSRRSQQQVAEAVQKAEQIKREIFREVPEKPVDASRALPRAQYFAELWYKDPTRKAIAEKIDADIATMDAKTIKRKMEQLQKKIAKWDNSQLKDPNLSPDIAFYNALERRLHEKGLTFKPAAKTAEQVILEAAKKPTSDIKAPLGPRVGDRVDAVSLAGSPIKGAIIEKIEGDIVTLRRGGFAREEGGKIEGGTVYKLPLKNLITQGDQLGAKPPVTEVKETPSIIAPKGKTISMEEAKRLMAEEQSKRVVGEAGAAERKANIQPWRGEDVRKEVPKVEQPKGASVSDARPPAPKRTVLQPSTPEQKASFNRALDLVKAGYPELATKAKQFAFEDRVDLSPDQQWALFERIVNKYLEDPKAGIAPGYAIAREGAPPISTWRAEGDQSPIESKPQTSEAQRVTPPAPAAPKPHTLQGQLSDVNLFGQQLRRTGYGEADIVKAEQAGKGDPKATILSLYRDRTAQRIQAQKLLQEAGLYADEPKGILQANANLLALGEKYGVRSKDIIDINNELFRAVQPKQQLKSLSPEATQVLRDTFEIASKLPELGVNTLMALGRGLEVSNDRKVFLTRKAMEIYRDGLAAGDPSALHRAKTFLRQSTDSGPTMRMDLFGLGTLAERIIKHKKTQLPLPSERLERIQAAQLAESADPGFLDKLKALPYSSIEKLYNRFTALEMHPNRFQKMFAPELIKGFAERSGIKHQLSEDINPRIQAELAHGGGAGVAEAATFRIGKVMAEAADAGLLDNLRAYLNLKGYDRAIRNIRGKVTSSVVSMNDLFAQAKAIEDQVKSGKIQKRFSGDTPALQLEEVARLRKMAREAKAEAKFYAKKLTNREVVPERYTQSEIAKDLDAMREILGDEDFARVEKMADVVYKDLEAQWDTAYRTGLINEAIWQKGKDMGRGYIPLQRIREAISETNNQYARASMQVKTRKLLQRLEGSELYNKEPLQAALDQIRLSNQEIQRNLVATTTLKLRELDPEGFGQAIQKMDPEGYLASGEGKIVTWENGEKTVWRAPEFLARALDNASPDAQSIAGIGFLRGPAKMFRTTATLANLAFSVPNVLRDMGDYGVLSKDHFKNPVDLARFTKQWAGSFVEAARQSPEYLEFLRSRAAFSNLQRQLNPIREYHQPVIGKLKKGEINPKTLIQSIEDFNNLLEEATKITAFRRGKERILQGEKRPLTKAETDALAYEVRRYGGSPDFAKGGTITPAINLIWMFFNAQLQGTVRTFARLVEDPKKAGVVVFSSALAAMAQQTWNSQFVDENGVRELDKILESEKLNNFIVIMPWTQQNRTTGEIRNAYRKIPKPHWAKVIYNPIEQAMDDYVKGSIDFEQLALDELASILPGSFNLKKGELTKGVVRGSISALNPLIKEPLEQAMNYDTFRGVPIEARGQENLEAPERFGPNTSQTARWTSRMIYDNSGEEQGLTKVPLVGPVLTSPERMAHAVRGFTTGIGEGALNVTDSLFFDQDKEFGIPLEGDERIAHMPGLGPILRRFVGNPGNQITKDLEQKFYRDAESAKVILATYKQHEKSEDEAAELYESDPRKAAFLDNQNDILAIERDLAALRNEVKAILLDKEMNAAEKQQELFELHKERLELLQYYETEILPELETIRLQMASNK